MPNFTSKSRCKVRQIIVVQKAMDSLYKNRTKSCYINDLYFGFRIFNSNFKACFSYVVSSIKVRGIESLFLRT